jgi:peptidoglycan/LPS O-acetylase OafA/YrhL
VPGDRVQTDTTPSFWAAFWLHVAVAIGAWLAVERPESGSGFRQWVTAIAAMVIVIGVLGTLRRSVRHGAVAGLGAFLALCGELVILVLDVGSKSQ